MDVAIIGASGIGKQHAKWFQLEGCRIVAFSGTSELSCKATGKLLQDMFGFDGNEYTDFRRMLDEESPDVVCVCSPQEVHLKHAVYALESGCHIYCEKPFAWPDPDSYSRFAEKQSPSSEIENPVLRETMADAQSLVALADARHLTIGMNAQYVAAREAYLELYELTNGPMGDVESFYFLLESKGLSGRYSHDEGIWIDMAPHALSQIIDWMPAGRIDAASISCQVTADRTVAHFSFGTANVEAEMGKSSESAMRRRFGVNGFLVDYTGRPDEDGVYKAFLSHGDDSVETEDYMRLSVRRFLDSLQSEDIHPYVDAKAALLNLESSMLVLEHSTKKLRTVPRHGKDVCER